MILTLGFTGVAINEYNQYMDFKDEYIFFKSSYENLVDGTDEEYNYLFQMAQLNYDEMINHQDIQNISLYCLGGLYTFNFFQLQIKLK